MLFPMNRHRPLLGNACAYSIRSFHRLRPNTAEPSAPISKSARFGLLAAMFDRGAGHITEQQSVAARANHRIKMIDFASGREDESFERLTVRFDFTGCQDLGRRTAIGVDLILIHTTQPRIGYFRGGGTSQRFLRDCEELFGRPGARIGVHHPLRG
jgi:hypothetical protein